MKLCYDCANVIDSRADICPYCGADTEAGIMPADQRHLIPGTYLYHDRYIIGRAVDSYENGVVYAAFDTYTQMRVAITEFFPEGIATRVPGKAEMRLFRGSGNDTAFIKGLQSFVDRSESLVGRKSESGECVLACFQENNTAYTVSEPLRAGPTAVVRRTHAWVYAVLIGVIVLCAVLAVLIMLGVIDLGEEQDTGSEPSVTEEMLTVPRLIGLTEEQARAQYPDWDIEYAGGSVSDEFPAGAIIAQDPEPDALVEPDTTIMLTVNIGSSQEGAIPFLYGMGVEQARELLNDCRVTEEYAYDVSLPAGCVMASVPEFGQIIVPGQEVRLTISRGGLLSGVEIEWNDAEIGMIPGQGTLHLTCRLLPQTVNSGKVNVEWVVPDSSIALVNEGTITAIKPGSTSVTVIASMINEDTGSTVSFTDSRRLSVTGGGQAVTTAVPTAVPAIPTLQPTPTPAPVTPRPVVTSAPSTERPGSTLPPVTPRPSTPKPGTTSSPATQAPVTNAPATPAPTMAPTAAPTSSPTSVPETERPTEPPATPAPTPDRTIGPALPTIPIVRPTSTPSPIVTKPPSDF